MTENKRFWYDFEDCDGAKIIDFKKDKEYPLETIGDFRKIEKLLNEQHEENMNLRAKNTGLIIILKDVVNDLKRMDTYRYAEHLEKIANIKFLSEKDLIE